MREKEKTLPERERVEDILAALTMIEQMMRSKAPLDMQLNASQVIGASPEDPVRWVRDFFADKLKDACNLIEIKTMPSERERVESILNSLDCIRMMMARDMSIDLQLSRAVSTDETKDAEREFRDAFEEDLREAIILLETML